MFLLKSTYIYTFQKKGSQKNSVHDGIVIERHLNTISTIWGQPVVLTLLMGPKTSFIAFVVCKTKFPPLEKRAFFQPPRK